MRLELLPTREGFAMLGRRLNLEARSSLLQFFSRLPETSLSPSALDLEGAHEEQRVVDLDCFRL